MPQPIVRLDRVTRRFPRGTVALENVSLSVADGDFVALLGPSGCGKSTLLRLAAGLDQPDGGRVETRIPMQAIGFVFQDPTLLPWASVIDNVRLPLRLRHQGPATAEADARTTLARVGLAGFERARPRELSGGMRMRVSLARALVARPRLLLMDEPFAALDEFTRNDLQDDLRTLCADAGCSVLFVTHAVAEAAYLARRIVLMSPRPGHILTELTSPLGDADQRLGPAHNALAAQILDALRPTRAPHPAH